MCPVLPPNVSTKKYQHKFCRKILANQSRLLNHYIGIYRKYIRGGMVSCAPGVCIFVIFIFATSLTTLLESTKNIPEQVCNVLHVVKQYCPMIYLITFTLPVLHIFCHYPPHPKFLINQSLLLN